VYPLKPDRIYAHEDLKPNPDAMSRLCDMGVPVRVKLKPVLPIRGWRESYGRCIEELLTRTTPETLGFASIIWMDYERLCKLFDQQRSPDRRLMRAVDSPSVV